MNTSLKPPALKSGGCIGVIAFSSPTTAARLAQGRQFLENLGYRVKVALDPTRAFGTTNHLFSSDTAEARCKALHEFLQDDEVQVILSARGAYGAMEMLSRVDFELIRRHPKSIVGFSDTTALLAAVHHHTGVMTIHGPALESMSRAVEKPEVKEACEATLTYLKGELGNPFVKADCRHFTGAKKGEGILSGGNLSILTALLGTPWEPNFDKRILFFEEIGEKPYRVHRMLLQMKLAGKLNQIAGVILGSFRDCERVEEKGPTLEQVLHDIFDSCPFPVISGLPFGHQDRNLPIALGVRARINDSHLEMLEPPVLV